MRSYFSLAAIAGAGLAAAIGCNSRPATSTPSASKSSPTTIEITAGPDAQKKAQTALINAKPGQVIEFGEGKFEFNSTLSLEDTSGITIRGKGPDKTTLSFANQQQGTGGEGIRVTSKENFRIENLAVEDCKGDAIKVQNTKGVVFDNVRAEWTGGPKAENGAYGIYPVMCEDVLIENSVVKGASDAGIYVGQSKNIIVRKNKVEQNVAGIEIENSINADVYENIATDNTGGILVFSLPDLPAKDGRACRVFKNQVIKNNHDNFAPPKNIVANVPPGTGMMIMANDEVEVFDNQIENNDSTGVLVCSYLITENDIKDKDYDPYCEAISIHDNKFVDNGATPRGQLGKDLGKILGAPFPDIMYDGYRNPAKMVDNQLPVELGLSIRNNGDADFVNFDRPGLAAAVLSNKKPSRDLKPFEVDLKSLAPVTIAGAK
ncbi:MAG TPA: parallel beta-helix domain-containing protein [Pirellulales bacterium]